MADDFSRRDFMKLLAGAGIYAALPIKAMKPYLPEYKPSLQIQRIGNKNRRHLKSKVTHQISGRIVGVASEGEIRETVEYLSEKITEWPNGGQLVFFTLTFDYGTQTGVAIQRIV